jgi:hypothetical protein
MPFLTLTEQKLIVSMLKGPITTKTQKTYRNRTSFYDAIWKLRDAYLVKNRVLENGLKEWRLTLDGEFLARVFQK